MNMSNVTDDMPVSEYLVAKAFDKIGSYTVYEYLSSKGNAYIDTNFKPNNNTRVEADLIYAPSTTPQWFFGTRDGVNVNSFGFMCPSSGNYRSDFGKNTNQIGATGFYDSFTIDKNKNMVTMTSHVEHPTIPGDYYQTNVTQTNSSFSCSNTLFIFGMNQGGSSNSYSLDAQIGTFKIYDNGTLIRDMVPAKNNNTGKYGFYDKLNSIFYPKKGTGTLTPGPEISVIDTSASYSKEKIASCKTVANILNIIPTNSSLDKRPVSCGLTKTYYLSIPRKLNLATATWQEIHNETLKINYTNYMQYRSDYADQIGTVRKVNMGTRGDVEFILAGIAVDYDKRPDKTPIENRKIAFTSWVSKNVIDGVKTPYPDSDLKTTISSYLTQFPSDLKTYVMEVSKSNNKYNMWRSLKVWCPSYIEFGGSPSTMRYDKGDSYPYFNSNETRIQKGYYYWTRSTYEPDPGYEKKFWTVYGDSGTFDNHYEGQGWLYHRIGFCV